MNWKVFTTACVSTAAAFFPTNGITCGPSEDPHDYYTSFFNNGLGTTAAYRSFYYTSLLNFYDDGWYGYNDSTAFINKEVAEEWKAYGKATSLKDAVELVYKTSPESMQTLAESIRTGKSMTTSLLKNSLAQNLVREKKPEAVKYLLFATKTQNVSASSAWADKPRDSLLLNKYINEAAQSYTNVTDPFIKNKYAFQRCKLAFYNNRHADCIRWYDEHFMADNKAAVSNLALSYKAGALFRTGKLPEAAYAYSKAFSISEQNKKSNFQGFLWASDYGNQKLIPAYTALCKTNSEKAAMTALFGMYGTDYRLDILQKVYSLDPSSPLLPLLATREINKLEENYFTPVLDKEKGGKALYVSWEWENDSSAKTNTAGKVQATNTAQFLESLFNDAKVLHRGVYGAGAAYLHFMNKDYEGTKSILAKTKGTATDEKTKEQIQLINLLVAANENKTLNAEQEARLLPSFKWLVQKAKSGNDYRLFCRNFFSQILAQKYEQQGDAARAAMAYGLADMAFLEKSDDDYFYSYPPAIDFVRTEMSTESLLALYQTMTQPATEAEKFFVQNSSFKRDDVIDVIGTSHLCDKAYAKAIEWLGKAGKPAPLVETQYNYGTGQERAVNVDPFFDYLNDWQRLNKAVATPYTKLSLAKKLLELKTKIASADTIADVAKLYYTYATALYNMSHYGNAWRAVAYYRSSSNWNEGMHKLPWEKEYYGVYTAKEIYQKAYETATDKEFKAACLFMVAKCAQRQIARPPYDYKNYQAYEKATALFQRKFMNNALFAKFKGEFGGTKFYLYAYNRCSYLRDFLKKPSPPPTRKVIIKQ